LQKASTLMAQMAANSKLSSFGVPTAGAVGGVVALWGMAGPVLRLKSGRLVLAAPAGAQGAGIPEGAQRGNRLRPLLPDLSVIPELTRLGNVMVKFTLPVAFSRIFFHTNSGLNSRILHFCYNRLHFCLSTAPKYVYENRAAVRGGRHPSFSRPADQHREPSIRAPREGRAT
jgi:hypothetical protein